MTRYPVLLVAVLLVLPMQGRLQAQSSATETVDETGQRTPLETGRVLFDQEKFAEALPYFDQAVEADEGSASAHYWQGMAQYGLEEYRKAVSSFKRSVELDEKWLPGYVGLGKSYLQIKHRRLDARHALRMAARLSPDDAEIQYYLGIVVHDSSVRWTR